MINTIFLFGTIAGALAISGIIATIAGADSLPESLRHSEVVGYLIMIVTLTTIFFGVKRYRDQELGGVIRFLPAFLVGLGIAIVAGIVYVAIWEAYAASTNNAYIEGFATAMIEDARAKGETPEAIAAIVKQMDEFRVMLANPFLRLPMIFMEIFPVGLIIALISAAILRNPRVLPARA